MNAQFQLAAGSVIGREHVVSGKNNQDAARSLITENATIAVVCDGCGSRPHSEVGAKVVAQLTIATIADQISLVSLGDWDALRQQLLTSLRVVVATLGGDLEETVRDYFLCTIVGAVLTPTDTSLFSLGDGVILLNGNQTDLGTHANNAPPYLAYGILEELDAQDGNAAMAKKWAAISQFRCHHHIPTAEVESILIGSDGVADLIQVADRPLPGKPELVGEVSQFWQDDRYFKNPDMVRRRLSLINREVTLLDQQTQQLTKHPGLLPDDTTLVVIRRVGTKS